MTMNVKERMEQIRKDQAGDPITAKQAAKALIRAAHKEGSMKGLTKEQKLYKALDNAAYALFQLKRFAGMPDAAVEFCRQEHAKACRTLNAMSRPKK